MRTLTECQDCRDLTTSWRQTLTTVGRTVITLTVGIRTDGDKPRTDTDNNRTDRDRTRTDTNDMRTDKDETKRATVNTRADTGNIETEYNTKNMDSDNIRTDFPEVLKAISFAINAEVSDLPVVGCLTSSNNLEEEELVQEELLAATSLTTQDWVKAQQEDVEIAKVKHMIEQRSSYRM